MQNLIIGIVIGAVFSPLIFKLFKIGWDKLIELISSSKK